MRQRSGGQWKAIPKPFVSRSYSAPTLESLSRMLVDLSNAAVQQTGAEASC